MLEVSMAPASVKALLESEPSPPVHPTRRLRFSGWMIGSCSRMNRGGPPLGPSSAFVLAGRLRQYLQWLLDHPSLLLGGFPKTTAKLLGEAFNLHIVHDLVACSCSSRTGCRRRGAACEKVLARCPSVLVKRWSCSRQSRG